MKDIHVDKITKNVVLLCKTDSFDLSNDMIQTFQPESGMRTSGVPVPGAVKGGCQHVA